jgi:hypothetical protein
MRLWFLSAARARVSAYLAVPVSVEEWFQMLEDAALGLARRGRIALCKKS